MSDRETTDRVCIIGAGPSGLAACKALHQANIPFECLEANRSIGGIWDVEGSQSGGYRSLHTNTSTTRMAYADFPFPDESSPFLHHSELLDYFHAYIDHFGFRKQIRLDCRVKSARPTEDGGWRLEFDDGTQRRYKACVVATGQYGTRRWPDPPPPGRFAGEQIHAADYLDPETPIDCRGKRVVVVGLGSSAAEIATELAGGAEGSPIASEIMLSARSGRYILPKLLDGEPLDASAPHPSQSFPGFIRWIPETLRTRFLRAVIKRAFGKIEAEIGRPSDWNLPDPTLEPWAERPTLSEGFVPALEARRIIPKSGIASFDESTIQFVDGSTADADIILWATGYRPGFPFLDEAVLGCAADELALYRRIAHPSHPNLFFIGFTRVICSLWPVSEQQSNWLVAVLKETIERPTPAEQARLAIQVSKTLPVFCNAYVFDLRQDGC